VGRQLAEDLPGFPAGLTNRLEILPFHPPGYRDRGARADSFEAVLNQGVDIVARSRGPRDRQVEHILDSRLQRLAETTEILPGLLYWSGRRRGRSHLIPSQARALNGHLQSQIDGQRPSLEVDSLAVDTRLCLVSRQRL